MALTKLVGNAGHGGQVLLSEAAFQALVLATSERTGDEPWRIVHMGEWAARREAAGAGGELRLNVFQAVLPGLEPRAALLGTGLRGLEQRSTGALDAPVHHAAIAFAHVVGASTLLAWNRDVATRAFATYHAKAAELLAPALSEADTGAMANAPTSGARLSSPLGGSAVLCRALAAPRPVSLSCRPHRLRGRAGHGAEPHGLPHEHRGAGLGPAAPRRAPARPVGARAARARALRGNVSAPALCFSPAVPAPGRTGQRPGGAARVQRAPRLTRQQSALRPIGGVLPSVGARACWQVCRRERGGPELGGQRQPHLQRQLAPEPERRPHT